jgi:glyoxylase-like metal-dependent hydrolase (beta-lactamase superfamily II)
MVNVYDTEIRHRMTRSTAWLPSQPAEQVDDSIWMSRSNSYPYLVTSDQGDLVINTGTDYQGSRHRERFEQAIGRPLDVRTIVLTQSHGDHVGGWPTFADLGVETIAHERLPETIEERRRIAPYLNARMTARLFERRPVEGEPDQPPGPRLRWDVPEPEVTTYVHDSLEFEVGGRRYVALSVPGGETLDALAVWLPEERAAWIGNLMGALWGALPHLSTIRGDRPRSATLFIRSVQRVLDLEPELLLTGHDEPIRGAERIQREAGRIVEAVRYIRDATIDGMNTGKDLHALMGEITLPPHLQADTGRGPVSWYVRAVWEEHVGWFKAETMTELYPVHQRAIWPELAGLVGGVDVLAERAKVHVGAGEPLEAIHYTDIALGVDPGHRSAREAKIAAMRLLLDRSDHEAFDEARLLELEIRREQGLLE